VKALFLDRDGVINHDKGYVHQIEEFEFTPSIFKLLHLFQNHGFILFIVTNQSGIGRGYYTFEVYQELTDWMLQRLQEQGIEIKKVACCPHRPDEKCDCRKPKGGMVESIMAEYPTIDLQTSWLIGDKQSDIDLALNTSIGRSIAITSKRVENATYHFSSIEACYSYLEENQATIV
jgi:D-glycero-D-manno-heptose 1,7-bisphosphate phosphatase